ncbi:MAG: alanine racemase [Nitrospirales bacterium]|nr:alanine racemase [Nitrospira sp.]MDR4502866.1 alanine racemase [Nitrospirales bacterium]
MIATIKLSALANNLSEIRRLIHSSCEILAIIKANAYGHGATRIAKTLVELGVQRFGVASVQEGCALRGAGISQPILVMGGLLPAQLPELIEHRLTPVLSNEEITHHIAEWLGSSHLTPYPVHLKIDTGMRRLGFAPECLIPLLENPHIQTSLTIEGLMTHLADADNVDPEFTRVQLERFQAVMSQVKLSDRSIALVHAANSAGIMYHPFSHFNMVRPGLMLYGCYPRTTQQHEISLQPVMKITTHIVQIRSVQPEEYVGYSRGFQATKPLKIAILPVGYAHGYARSLSNRGRVLIQGQRVPVVGKICMDMMMVDVSVLPHASIGGEVVLLGEQGEDEIRAEEMASWLNTIPYEIICNLGMRARHVYVSEENA